MTPGEAIQRLREVARRQHKAQSTEDSYAGWLARFMTALRQMPPTLPSEEKLERFLTELALANVSASTQNQAFNAIVFFYKDVLGMPLKGVDALRASRPARVRHAPTVEDTFLLMNKIKNVGGYPTNLIARLLYGCGLRVSEPLNLRVKDVRDDRLFIMGGKGRKDRVVSLPCSLANDVKGQLDFARAIWEKDVASKIPVEMPEGLSRKYPEYRFAWGWAWLFPGHQPCQHPRTGQWVRWRCHEANVQRAIKAARRELGIMVLPHELRHAYATHCLARGTNIKALQEAMGHKQVETTMGYCHADALSVRSPLEVVPVYPRGQSHIALSEPGGEWARVYPVARKPGADSSSDIAICEPLGVLELKASEEIRTEKEDPKLSTQELSRFAYRPAAEYVSDAHQKHARDRELVMEAFSLIGERNQRRSGGWYWNRVREDRDKFVRVLNAVRADKKERADAITNWGGHFFDLWRRFAPSKAGNAKLRHGGDNPRLYERKK